MGRLIKHEVIQWRFIAHCWENLWKIKAFKLDIYALSSLPGKLIQIFGFCFLLQGRKMSLCKVQMNIALLLIYFNGFVVSVWWLVQLMVFQPALLGSALDEMIVTELPIGSFLIMKNLYWRIYPLTATVQV